VALSICPYAATSFDPDKGDGVPFASHENTSNKTAGSAACLAGVIAWVYMVAVCLTEPNPVGLVTPFFPAERGIEARPTWRGSRYMSG
jgi:hypothetical protein